MSHYLSASSSITGSSSPCGLHQSNVGCYLRHQLAHLAIDLTALLEHLCSPNTPPHFPPPPFYHILPAVNEVHASSQTETKPFSLLLAVRVPLIAVLTVLSRLLTLTIRLRFNLVIPNRGQDLYYIIDLMYFINKYCF